MPDHTSPGFPVLNGEPLIPLAAVSGVLPAHRGSGHIGGQTVFRWITRGVRAVDGRVVRLEAVRLGSRWLTSAAAVGRFSAALTTPAIAPTSPTADPTTPSAPRRPTAAGRELDALGIC